MSIADLPKLKAADLLARQDDGHIYELVNGELVELNMSGETSWIAGKVAAALHLVIQPQVGWVLPVDAGFRCFPRDPEQVRKPDVAFVRRSRLSSLPLEGYIPVSPDLAVEVVSPNDLAYEVEAKVELWLSAGVQEVWVIMPRSRTVTIHKPNQVPRVVLAAQTIESPELPGFSAQVDNFFPPTA
ncbi:Uma2 family endonuclease [Anatilimnocola floriformis]|uniref:Uma2 family endonuclease n=1 Tax=Anatilimnocola floriformis TaxID=2948575 RepID=UPI0020C585E5|nr:Uma2 family endonuclease [Anatilimnocola floriformis]